MSWSKNKARDIGIINERKSGSTVRDIARRYKLSTGRVDQVWRKYLRRCRWLDSFDRRAVGFHMNDEFDIVGGPPGDSGARCGFCDEEHP